MKQSQLKIRRQAVCSKEDRAKEMTYPRRL